MSLITRMRRQKAVYWARSATANRFGVFTFSSPVEIECRWDDSAQQYRDENGEEALSNAVVYVDRDMKQGDRLKKGEMESDTPDDPMELLDSYEIKRFDDTPNLKATESLRTAYL